MPAKQETLPQGAAKLEYWPVTAIVSAPDAKVSGPFFVCCFVFLVACSCLLLCCALIASGC